MCNSFDIVRQQKSCRSLLIRFFFGFTSTTHYMAHCCFRYNYTPPSQFHGLCLSESALKSQNHKWMLAFCVKPHIIMNHIPLLATFVKSLLDCLTYLLHKVANFELFCWNFLSITNSEKGEVTMYNSIKVYFIISISISPFIVQYT